MHSPAVLAAVLSAASLASAHFQLEYPAWRADSLNSDSYSQYDFPCAGVPSASLSGNRTDWPITGGSLELDLHHHWSYIFINIGLGVNVTNFNYTLTPNFWNETGSGILCVPHLDLPADLTPSDGQLATLQVVTVSESGAALYNCADIAFRDSASVADFGGANCTTDAAVSYSVVNEEVNGTTTSTTNSTSSTSASTNSASGTAATSGSAGPIHGQGLAALTSVVALTVAFVCGMTL